MNRFNSASSFVRRASPTKTDGYWLQPRTSLKLSVLQAEGQQSEFKATIQDTADTADEWEDLRLVDLEIRMQEYPADLLLARLDALRAALATWIELGDDPNAISIATQLKQQMQVLNLSEDISHD